MVGAQDVDASGRLRIPKHPHHVIHLGVEDQPGRGFRIPGDREWKPGAP